MTEDYGPTYTGPFVILRPEGMGYRVTVEPSLPVGGDCARTYGDKHSAWGYCRELWEAARLPFRDETDGHTGRENARKDADE